jgi:ABC-type branched-subunit amino acid transport system permease subunit
MDLVTTMLDGILLGGLYALFSSGLSLIFGVMRLVNIAHGDLIVLSAFIALVVTAHLGVHPLVVFLGIRTNFDPSIGPTRLPPILAVLAAGVVAALLAVPTAWVIFRLKGAYFAIGTWVVAEVYRLVFAQVSALGAGSGTSLPTQVVQSIAPTRVARDNLSYWTGLGLVVAVLAVT